MSEQRLSNPIWQWLGIYYVLPPLRSPTRQQYFSPKKCCFAPIVENALFFTNLVFFFLVIDGESSTEVLL